MGWFDGGHHVGFMGFGWLLILIVLAIVVWAAVAAGRGGGRRDTSPEQRLKERYAAGEIDHATYERMLADLRR